MKNLTEQKKKDLLGSKLNKYKNKIVFVDGIKFDSKAEAGRYCELKILQRAGKIKDLELQKKFVLMDDFKTWDEQKVKGISYIADFYYYDNELLAFVAEDVKGILTKDYIIKKKLFMFIYRAIFFKEIKKEVEKSGYIKRKTAVKTLVK